MKLFLFRFWKFITYKYKCVGPHGLHSPFLFELYNQVIIPSRRFRLPSIEKLRRELEVNHEIVELYDLKTSKSERKTISSIAKMSLSYARFSAFLNRLINHLEIKKAVETGTSFGINAMYMVGSDHIQKLTTIEASPVISAIAKQQFSKLFQRKIQIKNGTINDLFESTVLKEQPELCFIDADHRSEAVLFCIDKIMTHCSDITCIIIHDIYWSKDMSEAWSRIKEDTRFTLTIDIFQAGIVFPNKDMPKQHFTLRF